MWLSNSQEIPECPLGQVWNISHAPHEIAAFVGKYRLEAQADALLFWDAALGRPDAALVEGLLDSGDDVWHAGLKLNNMSQPDFIDFVLFPFRLQ